jgi:hypothetical protein
MIIIKDKEPVFIIGTNRGNLYIIPLTYNSKSDQFTLFFTNLGPDEISNIFFERNLLFVSTI